MERSAWRDILYTFAVLYPGRLPPTVTLNNNLHLQMDFWPNSYSVQQEKEGQNISMMEPDNNIVKRMK
jgi:hypothetical protein